MNNKNSSEYSNGHLIMALNGNFNSRSIWYIASGASSHICRDQNLFTDATRKLEHAVMIQMGNGTELKANYEGDVNLICYTGCGVYEITVKNVLYLPQVKINLLSIVQVQKRKYCVKFSNDECTIFHQTSQKTALKLSRTGIGFKFEAVSPPDSSQVYLATGKKHSCFLWHNRLGNCGKKVLNEIKSDKPVRGDPTSVNTIGEISECHACDLRKMSNFSFRSTSHQTKPILELVHTDLCGPMKVDSVGKEIYFGIFGDDFSRITFVYFLKNKIDAANIIKTFILFAERQSG